TTPVCWRQGSRQRGRRLHCTTYAASSITWRRCVPPRCCRSCTTSSWKSRKMPSPSSSSTRVKNIWLQILLDYLDEYVGGFRCDSGEGAGPNVTDIGLAGGRGGGRGGGNLGESNTSTGGGEMASASCD
ncbi:unnamed protein product, partial [Pylaiella littoralis]